jgi:hypothetical protein
MNEKSPKMRNVTMISMAGGDLVAKVAVGVGVAIADRHPGYLGLFGRHLADSGEVPETRHNGITPGIICGTQRTASRQEVQ